jgi:predicted esterase
VFEFVLLLFITTRFATQTPDNQTVIPLGQIVDKVVCAQDVNQTYALYLPSNYVSTRKWPILYAFDPGARGRIPVERFRDAAERFGWIIVGSNNSRNASIQASLDSWNAITRDTAARFSLDDGRDYAAGFSGGARVAILFATQCNDCLTGVFASGAGFPEGVEPSAKIRFAVFGAAGIEDFNFPEMKLLDEKLERAGITHRTETFEGRHEWPPSSTAVDALAWMELLAMKSALRPRDETLIDTLWNERLKRAQAAENVGRILEAYQIYLEMSATFKTLRDVAEIEKKLEQLRNTREVRDGLRDEQQQIKKQKELEGQIIGLIVATQRTKLPDAASDRNPQANDETLDPYTRLKGILATLRRQAKAEEDSATRRVARRVVSGQYAGLFERGSNSLQTQKRYDEAVHYFTLATDLDPERAGAFYYLAWAYNAKGDRKKSLKALQTAVDKGFSDVAGLENNKAFDSLRDDPQYQKIINALKAKR